MTDAQALTATIQQATARADPAITRIEFAPGHEDARLADDQVAALMRKVRLAPRMLALLKRFDEFATTGGNGGGFVYPLGSVQELSELIAEADGRSPQEPA